MSANLEHLFSAALALPSADRAILAEMLLESLKQEDQAEIDRAWAEEADRRLQDFRQGTLKAIPGDEVLRGIRDRYARRKAE